MTARNYRLEIIEALGGKYQLLCANHNIKKHANERRTKKLRGKEIVLIAVDEVMELPISEFTGETYDPAWGTKMRVG